VQLQQVQVIPLTIPETLLTPCALIGLEGDTVSDLVNFAIDQGAVIACYQAKQNAVRDKVKQPVH
jgi:hypothetical protein